MSQATGRGVILEGRARKSKFREIYVCAENLLEVKLAGFLKEPAGNEEEKKEVSLMIMASCKVPVSRKLVEM